MNNTDKPINPLSGLAGMNDGSDTKRYESQQIGAGDTLNNSASKGRLTSGSEQSELAGGNDE
jgi:hypothetical protein